MSQKRKITILNISLASGGAEKVISLLLKELVKDFDVTLLLFYNEIHFPVPEKVKIVFFSPEKPDRPIYKKIADAIRFVFKYKAYINRNRIDYAVSFLAFPNLINGISAIFNKKTVSIVSERGFPSDNTTRKSSLYISKFFYPILYNRCDKLFSNSEHINRDLKENFGVTIPMKVIYNPIENPELTIDPEDLEHSKLPLRLITAGTLNTRKNQSMVLDAMTKIDPGSFTFTLLGSGHLEQHLKDKSKNLGLTDCTIFKGKVKNVGEFFLENHCFVLSSFTEGFPNALLEAMSYGLPCISTNCLSGPLELLNDNEPVEIQKGSFVLAKYGILIQNNDSSALAAALEYFVKNPKKRVYYSQMSLLRSKDYELYTIYGQFKSFITS